MIHIPLTSLQISADKRYFIKTLLCASDIFFYSGHVYDLSTFAAMGQPAGSKKLTPYHWQCGPSYSRRN